MPFDGNVVTFDLESYKASAIAAAPPASWWCYFPKIVKYLPLYLISTSILTLLPLGKVFHNLLLVPMLTCMIMSVLVLIFTITGIKIRGPAEWKERSFPGINEKIEHFKIFERGVVAKRSGCTLIIGELIQDKVNLDPYLIAVHPDNTRELLAVWEGDIIKYLVD